MPQHCMERFHNILSKESRRGETLYCPVGPVRSLHRCPLYNTTFIAQIANKNWNSLRSKGRLAVIFKKPPLFAYRTPEQERTRFMRNTTDNTLTPRGCRPNQMLVFEEKGKPEYPQKNLSVQSRKPANSTHI